MLSFLQKKALYWAQQNASPLPAGFMRLEYIESTGTQWIDTGIMLPMNKVLAVDCALKSANGSIFGASGGAAGASVNDYFIGKNISTWTLCYNGRHDVGGVDTERHLWKCDNGTWYIDGSVVATADPLTTLAISKCYLFCRRRLGGTFGKMSGSIYAFYCEDTLDMEPMLALPGTTYIDGNTGNPVTAADFKPGMYDYVSNRFFVNQATSGEDFLYIPDNEVWYAADSKQTLYTSTGVVSHEFADGRGVLKFASAVTTVSQWFRRTAVTAVVLPKTVTAIGNNAFEDCNALERVAFQNGVTHFGMYCFRFCTSLRMDYLPPSLTVLGYESMRGCTSMASLSALPDSLLEIKYSAFRGITGLELSVLPASVSSIEQSAFCDCWPSGSGHSLTFLGKPESLHEKAFYRTQGLSDIYVPWSEGEVEGAPWGADKATIHYNSTPTE